MSSARETVLGRVREALGGEGARASAAPVASAYRRVGTLSDEQRVALFCARVADYRAEVERVPAPDVAAAIGEQLAARRARRIGIPAGLPVGWRPPGLELVEDDDLDAGALDRLDGVVTGCRLAIAETGTIVLGSGPAEGRRALTLVPDLHVCVVVASRIVELVPQAIAALAAVVRDERAPLTFVSGPSATSDIELNRIEGVHGPRKLVVLVSEEP